jgi:ribosome maturation factor RimP
MLGISKADMAGLAMGDLDKRFIQETGIAAKVAALAEPVIEALGLRLVRVSISAQGGKTLQIMADRPGGAISVDDCATISRQVSPLLDAHEPIQGGYVLEVSSPGIARPLVRPSDFDDWAGYEAKIELSEMIDGRRRFRGILDGFEKDEVLLRIELKDYDEPQVIGLPVALIQEARLVLTDDLLKQAQTANDGKDAVSDTDAASEKLE